MFSLQIPKRKGGKNTYDRKKAVTNMMYARLGNKNIIATFMENPSLKLAFDSLWEKGEFDEWILRTAHPLFTEFLKDLEVENCVNQVSVVIEIAQTIMMKESMERGMEKFIQARCKSCLGDEIVKTIEEEGEDIIQKCKDGFSEYLHQMHIESSVTDLIELLFKAV